jgi:N-acetylglucosamine kinase-like BadF-type ATPase
MVISGAESGDDLALQAVDKVAKEVIEVLRPLVKRLDQDERDPMLVVAGGLGQVDLFWSRVVEEMEKLGWTWYEIVKMAEPALEGVKLLAQFQPG